MDEVGAGALGRCCWSRLKAKQYARRSGTEHTPGPWTWGSLAHGLLFTGFSIWINLCRKIHKMQKQSCRFSLGELFVCFIQRDSLGKLRRAICAACGL